MIRKEMKLQVKDIITKNVISCDIGCNISKIASLMLGNWARSILVKEHGRYVGIITDGIIFSKIARNPNLTGLKAKDIMYKPIPYIAADRSINEIWKNFNKTAIKRLVVKTTDGTILGIIDEKLAKRYVKIAYLKKFQYNRLKYANL
jgi:predicted transcriptional regulator